jgi:10 TM Acyl Transferase domain found in Cas1p
MAGTTDTTDLSIPLASPSRAIHRNSSNVSVSSTSLSPNRKSKEESLDSTSTEKYSKMTVVDRLKSILLFHWQGRAAFVRAQLYVAGIIVVAAIINNWPHSYHRNDNHNPTMFWLANLAIVIAAGLTLKHDPTASSRGVQLLSRPQTEEWKGWMQWAFIMVRAHAWSYQVESNLFRLTLHLNLFSIITTECTQFTMRFEFLSVPTFG